TPGACCRSPRARARAASTSRSSIRSRFSRDQPTTLGKGSDAMKIRVSEHAKFRPDKMAKIALATTSRCQLDLYCLEPGQDQKAHAHDDQDKIYFVLGGRGRV